MVHYAAFSGNEPAAPIIDMGADEFQRVSSCPWDCVGDDNEVGIDEFLKVLGLWGPCP